MMRLARPPRRARPETIVALVDVTFFLLVFFLLVARMDATAPFVVLPPTGQHGTDMLGGGATISVSAGGDLALDGQPVARADLLPGLAPRLRDQPDLLVRINADRAAPLRHVLPLVADLTAAGFADVVLAVTPEAP